MILKLIKMKLNFLNTILAALALSTPMVGFGQGVADDTASSEIVIVPSLEKFGRSSPFDTTAYAGYLLTYFKDETHSTYFAVSADGYTFTDINNGDPVMLGAGLAEQKGVRDPHITRGPDGAFYLAMTDLHIYGKRAGYRSTEWQRPEDPYGWGNNRAIVLMKSYDFIHWTHSDFRVDQAFPELGDIDCAWAPQTIYDPARKKMMVYFTIRYNNKNAHIYYAYANDAFTRLETKPERITEIGGIDADICKVGDQYHMYYVSDAKLFHSVSGSINAGFKVEGKRIDPETVSTEAPNVFRRINTDTYVLMYDVYGARPNNMGFSETTDFINYVNLGHFNEGVMKGTNFSRPKHGAVTYLTKAELKAITEHWKVDLNIER